ncbi:hypothetical protein [Xanthomonas nasturtii]|uniref:hypothetical protein n=1 Tax=Xanthomonas nasturtii TaxID=1843581 RepID=UPI002011A723|nr:hypothetical protein [Xanthomonas nasturtii]MCL1499760.1 hypothetical protein [Xanthomonas nasturtii]MCL1503406.1 hypothetical protein [Xanthomonas nasturtii]MCL1521476.1 hypothetical protein [Xanthomonas nasturtii]
MNSLSGTLVVNPKKADVALKDLKLDVANPRFGGVATGARDQADVLDHIVNTFGVDDLLSSLSVNGYFEAEPLVVREEDGELIVAEGNRRLAACLMLVGDERAYRQREKAQGFIAEWQSHNRPSIDPVPVIIFEGKDSKKGLLSYLGVRHISSSKSWDSYAKAAWVAEVVELHGIAVPEIARMIGDQHRTIERLLQGYYLVKQLQETGDFRPEDSLRRGRGSVADYPFSWVYTILGYAAAQKYLDVQPGAAKPNPLKEESTKKGRVLMRAMFGDRSAGRNSSVSDSRQLGDLASLLVNPETLTLVEQGKSVDEIKTAVQPIDEKLRMGVEEVREILRDLVSRMDEVPVSKDLAISMMPPSEKAASLAISLFKKLQAAAIASTASLELPGLGDS